MKNLILVIAILFSTIVLKAQTDIIYPVNDTVSIQGCVINDIKDGNMVFYTKDSISNVIEADGVYRNGNYIALSSDADISPVNPYKYSRLYKGHYYDYYSNLHTKALSKRNIGIGLTFFGLSAAVAGGLILRDGGYNNITSGIIPALYFGGALIADIGTFLWISGGVKASNNKKAMEFTQRTTNLSFATTANGIGLVLSF